MICLFVYRVSEYIIFHGDYTHSGHFLELYTMYTVYRLSYRGGAWNSPPPQPQFPPLRKLENLYSLVSVCACVANSCMTLWQCPTNFSHPHPHQKILWYSRLQSHAKYGFDVIVISQISSYTNSGSCI